MERDLTKGGASLYTSSMKFIPPRPENPAVFPETSPEHWYDKEFAGWHTGKRRQPSPCGTGTEGKRIALLLAGDHPYQKEYLRGLREAAVKKGMILSIYNAGWDPELQEQQMETIITEHPDMAILMPENNEDSSYLYRHLYEAGIPVIASNMLPEDDGFPYILSWTGPDDWEQTRQLGRRFAKLMKNEGGYAIVTHLPGTSPYYARAWGAITELHNNYPRMQLLEMDSAGLNRQKTCEMVLSWLKKHGTRLKGIISADDNVSQLGINDALTLYGRKELVRVANGSTPAGINLLRNGDLDAITWQDPVLDGALPVETAVDWFRGLEIEPVKYLPVRIVDKESLDQFVREDTPFRDIETDKLIRGIIETDSSLIHQFFDELLRDFNAHPAAGNEYSLGFMIEILSDLISLMKKEELDRERLTGGYVNLHKQLVKQKSPEELMSWLRTLSLEISDLLRKRSDNSIARRLISYVEQNHASPLSLKTLSQQFQLSASYLGKLFREEAGESFSSYLNRIRIDRACHLLKTNAMNAGQVGIEVGFTSRSYFFRTFHKITGSTPSDYQDILRKK